MELPMPGFLSIGSGVWGFCPPPPKKNWYLRRTGWSNSVSTAVLHRDSIGRPSCRALSCILVIFITDSYIHALPTKYNYQATSLGR